MSECHSIYDINILIRISIAFHLVKELFVINFIKWSKTGQRRNLVDKHKMICAYVNDEILKQLYKQVLLHKLTIFGVMIVSQRCNVN